MFSLYLTYIHHVFFVFNSDVFFVGYSIARAASYIWSILFVDSFSLLSQVLGGVLYTQKHFIMQKLWQLLCESPSKVWYYRL